VYNAKNIARVRRDEREASERQRLALESAKAFERTSRLQMLRSKQRGVDNENLQVSSRGSSQTETDGGKVSHSKQEALSGVEQVPSTSNPIPDFTSIPVDSWYTKSKRTNSSSARPVTQTVADPLDLVKHYESITEQAERKERESRKEGKRHKRTRKKPSQKWDNLDMYSAEYTH
jgi:hypothetical protein